MSIFNSVQIPKVPRSRFNMSHYNNMSADYGRLYPFLFIDCVPNDTFKLGADVLINTAPMITAPYTQNDVRLDYFFVPYRLLWDNWKDFITGGEDGTAEPTLPFINTDMWEDNVCDYSAKCLLSYFGVKCFDGTLPVTNVEPINSLPLRAYALIWNEWYRDQNLQEEIEIYKSEDDSDLDFLQGYSDFCDDYGFLLRGWRKDYFTSALPSPQRGVEVPINFGSNFKIPVEMKSQLSNVYFKLTNDIRAKMGDDLVHPDEWASDIDITVGSSSGVYLRINADGEIKQVSQESTISGPVVTADEIYDIYAPLGQWLKNLMDSADPVTHKKDNPLYVNSQDFPAITINDLRRANAIQVWLERNMRAGARYVEQILSHFGVRVPDYRLDRPEYIGGNTFPVQISQIFQNSESTQDSSLGSYGGKGKATTSCRVRKYRVEEHGCIIGLMSILPKAVYANGINHYFLQHSKFDYYFPEFANLGEQEIKAKEVAVTEDMVNEQGLVTNDTFGYTPRYAHMKFISNQVNGDFLLSGMRHFTQFRSFTTEPTLSAQFIRVSPKSDGINRIWAVEDAGSYDHFWCTIFNQVHAKRPMPKYGTPKLIG